jgi:hypothetical protein
LRRSEREPGKTGDQRNNSDEFDPSVHNPSVAAIPTFLPASLAAPEG